MNLPTRIITRLLLLGVSACLLTAWVMASSQNAALAVLVATASAAAIAAVVWRGLGRPFLSLLRRASAQADAPNPDRPGPWLDDWSAGAEQVADRLEQHGRACDERQRQLEATMAERAQRSIDFLANTVHELRTPLTTVIASLDMLHDGYVTTLEERDEITEQGAAACRHLMMLINDLLDTSAYESGKLQLDLQECDVEELVHEAQHLLRTLAIARGVDLQMVVSEADLRITTDRSRVLQVLFNLVGNALKFAPSGSCVLLQALLTPIGIAFEIVDDGPGVPAEARARLFTKYGRLHKGPSTSGTGIGLYLSKILVEQMDGSIGYVPRDPGPGSIFWFTLPSASVPATAAASTASPR